MTYKPQWEINEKSPGVWQEVRRLEAEVKRLRRIEEAARDVLRDGSNAECLVWEDALRAALEEK